MNTKFITGGETNTSKVIIYVEGPKEAARITHDGEIIINDDLSLEECKQALMYVLTAIYEDMTKV